MVDYGVDTHSIKLISSYLKNDLTDWKLNKLPVPGNALQKDALKDTLLVLYCSVQASRFMSKVPWNSSP